MKRHMKNVPVKSRQKLFSMNISNFFILNMFNCHYSNGATKVEQIRELRKFFYAKIPNGAKDYFRESKATGLPQGLDRFVPNLTEVIHVIGITIVRDFEHKVCSQLAVRHLELKLSTADAIIKPVEPDVGIGPHSSYLSLAYLTLSPMESNLPAFGIHLVSKPSF